VIGAILPGQGPRRSRGTNEGTPEGIPPQGGLGEGQIEVLGSGDVLVRAVLAHGDDVK
jgi:hypothetical protein